ncbi:MAG: biopolymer transporter ExbD [Planctomycetes bacterium]|nr:biopolymer transporter ExbD [Planctomycetota bacterium]
MSISFHCVSCNRKINVHDRFATRMLRCPSCDTNQRVPDRSTLPATQQATATNVIGINQDLTAIATPVIEPARVDDVVKPSTSYESGDGEYDEPTAEARSSRRSKDKGHGKEEEDLEWDITPMVDVAFLLLIFFMLTASFSIQKAIPTSAEEKEKPSRNPIQRERTDQPESFVIQIDEFNAYTVISNDGGTMDATSKQELIVVLQDLKSQLGEVSPRVIIQAHSLSLHGAVVACMDGAREAGFDSFQMQSVDEFD